MKVIFFWGHWNGDRSKIDELCGIYGKDEMLQKAIWFSLFERSIIATTQRTYLFDCWDNKVSKEICCEHWILLIIYLRNVAIIRFTDTSMYFSYFNFEVLSILGNRLSSFAVFLWYWNDTFLWQEELLYFPFYGGSNFVFSSWFLFYIGKRLSPRKLQNVK